MLKPRLFPLNRGGRFAAHVVHHAVDAFDFVDDAVGHFAQERVGQLGPVRGHEVAGNHSAQGDDVVVSAAVAHHADGFHGQEHGKCLAGEVVPRGAVFVFVVAQFLNENVVCLAQQVGVFALHFAQNPHAQAGAGEGVAVHYFARQAERHAQFAHFVFEQIAQLNI